MKKRVVKKKRLSLNKETIASLQHVTGGVDQENTVVTDTDTDTFPSGGPVICYFSDCNPCETQYCTQQ